ncbi:peptide-methionine (S)-S-oxide reductase MsrA [Alphaproteobacteria bacterium KMM 3653]|uniref:Peptide methionine sulfoxide reductase MsrA n=1 Tax=Harenicola maris TaxID=2841044 RepID=A0AAP2CNG8_9RHOB|nr:peptide-methionine (S)-S-oxide reductase MsrA [Harenicola maris]
MKTLLKAKPALLALVIGLGILAQNQRAEAAPLETALVAGGCFWCVEADFEKVKGVKSAVSGFAGGTATNPSYKQVTKGGTGHYEAVQITYDPDQVSYGQIINMFFRSVDPTDAGGQFCDRGESYRTAIFASNSAQKGTAEKEKAKAQSDLGQQIVTPILGAAKFYPASDAHQDYYKSGKRVVTRAGVKTKAEAYKFYRASCGRDARVKQLWGSSAPFVGG